MANSAFRIVELGPDGIKTNLKNYLRQQTEFTDYNFEGSGLNILLDILAYNTHYLAFYMNMLGAESFLESAQLRNSVVSHAKHVGYTPESMKPSRAIVTVKVTPSGSEDTALSVLTLPRWTRFLSRAVDGTNYNYIAVNSNTAVKVGNTFTFSNIVIKQGEVISRSYLASSGNPDRSYYIPTANVDIDEIYVSVQKSATNTHTTTYTRHQDLNLLRSNSTVYFIDESTVANNNYRIYFGDNVLGQKPDDGEIITITYLVTDGDYSNGANSFILQEDINGFDDNVTVTTVSSAYGGAAREDIETIRYRAPKYYTTQNRAVTARDYETLISQDYPSIDSISVWGGENEIPPVYGKVFISLKPKDNYYITNAEKQAIIDDIIATRSVMTVIPEIIEPDYTWLLVNAKVFYDKAKTNLDMSQMNTLVRNAILAYRDANLKKFDSKYRVSRLQRTIENSSSAINSATIENILQKRLTPTLRTAKNYTINFKKELRKDTLYTFPSFQTYDSAGILRSVYIEEVPRSYTGLDRVIINSAGNDYEDVTVTITGDGSGATATATILNKKISEINVVNRGSNYTQATVSITSNTGFGASATADLQYNNGVLRIFYFKSNGEKVVINENAGSINYRSGLITLDNLDVYSVTNTPVYNSNIITFNVEPDEPDISPIRNTIVDIDENDSKAIQINLVAE